MVFGDAHRDHVLLDIFAELDACIVAAGNDIEVRVIGGDIKYDVRMVMRKLRQLRREQAQRLPGARL